MYTFLLIKPGFHSWINAIKEGIYKMGTLTFYHKWEQITFSCFSHAAQTERGNKYQIDIFFAFISHALEFDFTPIGTDCRHKNRVA